MTRVRRTLKLPRLKLPAGAKVLKVKLPEPEVDREPGPRLICKGVVLGRAIPWKSPRVSQSGGVIMTRDYKSYVKWKQTIATQARLDMGRRKMYGGPVALKLTFYLRPTGRTRPDLDNIQKCFSDGLQKIVIHNDVEVHKVESERVMSATEPQRVVYEVWAI